jgi:hypothetical protein
MEMKKVDYGTILVGPMYYQYLIPQQVRYPFNVVLVHGGGGQGTHYFGRGDGEAGWAHYFAQAGFRTYIVDRPGQGRPPWFQDSLGARHEGRRCLARERVGRTCRGGNEKRTKYSRPRKDGACAPMIHPHGYLRFGSLKRGGSLRHQVFVRNNSRQSLQRRSARGMITRRILNKAPGQ